MSKKRQPESGESSKPQFEQLIEDARNGDPSAVGNLVEHCRGYLLAVANEDIEARLKQKIGASDLVQESMLAAQQNIGQFRGSTQEEFVGWLRGILINQMRDARRYMTRQKREMGREAPIDESGNALADKLAESVFTPGTDAARKEQAKLLEDAMSRLPDDYQQVLRMRNWQQMTFEEIGAAMDRTADATRKLWARALFRLEQEVGDSDKDTP